MDRNFVEGHWGGGGCEQRGGDNFLQVLIQSKHFFVKSLEKHYRWELRHLKCAQDFKE